MIEVPPTVSWPRVTVTSESNFSTVCTNLAEARACRPFLLTIGISRARAPSGMTAGGQSSVSRSSRRGSALNVRPSFPGQHARGHVNVFAARLLGVEHGLGERLLVAHA